MQTNGEMRIGQSLNYGLQLNLKPAIALIMGKEDDYKHLIRINSIISPFNLEIDVFPIKAFAREVVTKQMKVLATSLLLLFSLCVVGYSPDEIAQFERFIQIGGYPAAETLMGFAYYRGDGVGQSYEEAVKWFRKAADQGNATAQYALGNAYRDGNGVPQDEEEAKKWYRKAAEQGFAHAQRALGGPGNYTEAEKPEYVSPQPEYSLTSNEIEQWRKAGERGHAEAQWRLGMSYHFGDGVSQDYTEAITWFRKAADQGFTQAQWSLANAYYTGQGVSQDYTIAYAWWNLAATNGLEAGEESRAVVAEKMTEEQIGKALELSREMIEENPKPLGE